MIKVLHLFTTLDNGGVESFLFNYYSNMDHSKILFDFVVPGYRKGFLEDDLVKMNSKIFHVSTFKKNPFLQYKELLNIVKEGNYDIIHCHGYKSFIGLIVAKKCNIKTRIIHSHMAFVKENFIEKIVRIILTFIIKKYATVFFACGIDAANWLYGKRFVNSGNVSIINNAVDLDKYRFNSKYRDIIRNSYCENESTILIGIVARLSKQKNQIYALNVMKKILDDNRNVKLLLIGNGEDEKYLKEKVSELNLSDHVLFLGIRDDVNVLLSGLDVFLLPSLYEGLPVVLAEVQASGVNCIVSDTITHEIEVTNNIYYLSLDDDYLNWVNKIKEVCENDYDRDLNYKCMLDGKYDIKYQSNKLYDLYCEKVGE